MVGKRGEGKEKGRKKEGREREGRKEEGREREGRKEEGRERGGEEEERKEEGRERETGHFYSHPWGQGSATGTHVAEYMVGIKWKTLSWHSKLLPYQSHHV